MTSIRELHFFWFGLVAALFGYRWIPAVARMAVKVAHHKSRNGVTVSKTVARFCLMMRLAGSVAPS